MRKITRCMILCALLWIPILTIAQVQVSQYAMETGNDASKWVTLPSDATNLIPNGGNYGASELTNIGFDFTFGGSTYTQFSVNTDGNLKFGAPVTGTTSANQPFGFGNAAMYAPKVNGFGCDGDMSYGGYAKCAVMGTAPNRKLVVEYNVAEYSWFSSDPDIMWQVQLYEGSNEVMLVYAPAAPEDPPSSFQIGMATSASDVLTVNTTLGSISTGPTGVTQSHWPMANTYYRFYQSSCVRPSNLMITSQINDGVNFSWSASEGQSTWQYLCVASGVSPNWTMAETVHQPSGSVSGLLPNTDYRVYVRSDCGADDVSDAAIVSFHTGCVPMDVPYMEDFEHYEEDDIPNCWSSHNGGSVVVEGSWNSHVGNGSLVFGCGDTMVAPLIKLPANQIHFTAWIMSEDPSAGSLEVGYATTEAATDFVSVTTITPLHTHYQEYVVDFSSLEVTDTVYLVFKHNVSQMDLECWYRFYMDDVKIERASSCPRPEFAYVRNVDYNAATIVWGANDEVVSYEVAYGVTDTVANATRIIVPVGDDSVRIENLMSRTTYYAWVRNRCDSDSSMWRVVEPFTTTGNCATVKDMRVASVSTNGASVSWVIDHSYGVASTAVEFSFKRVVDDVWSAPVVLTNQNYYILQNLESGYAYEARVKTICGVDSSDYAIIDFTTESCGTVVEDASSNTFTHYVPFGGLYKYVYSQMLYTSSRLVGVDTIKGIAFHVDDAEVGETRLVDVYLMNTSSAVINLAQPLNMASVTKVATDAMVMINEGWISIMFDNEFVYDGTSNLGVVVYDHTGSMNEFVYVCTNTYGNTLYKRSDHSMLADETVNVTGLESLSQMPDIRFISDCPIVECAAPTVAFESITNDAISIHWVAGMNESQWSVEYRKVGETDWITETVATPSYVFSGLESGTDYELRIGASCGGSIYYATLTATTQCDPFELPFVEHFDDATLGCWTLGTTDDDAYISWTTDMGNGALDYGFSSGAYAITPAIDAPINTLQVTFKLGSFSFYSDGALVVSVGESPDNLISFVPIDTVTIATEAPLTTKLVSLESYTGNGRYIMFSSLTGEVALDDILIEAIPSCSMPTQLVASNITEDGATISWTDNGTAVEKWLVSYCEVGCSNAIVYEVELANGATHTVTGLASNTEYVVSVATICNNGDTTETLYPILFTTNCSAVTIPYFEGFDKVAVGGFHNCWYRDVPSTTHNTSVHFEAIQVPSVIMGDLNSNTVILSDQKAIISPRIPLPANQISVNFDMKVLNNNFSGDLVVGFTTDPSHLNSMVGVDTLSIMADSWSNQTVDFNHLATTDTGYVVFKNINSIVTGGWIQTYYYTWLDNIGISKYSSCARPTNGQMSNITATTANLTFSDANQTNNYTITWNTQMAIDESISMNITTPSAQLTNLLPSTTYYVWARSNCSATQQSAWMYMGSFRTACDVMPLPYNENFDSYTYGVGVNESRPALYPNHAMPNCWEIIGMNRSGADPLAMISNYPEYAVSGNTFYLEAARNKHIFMVLPDFEPRIDSLMLSFSYRLKTLHDTPNEFVLGVMTNPMDTSTFIPIEDMLSITQMHRYSHAFVYDDTLNTNLHYRIAFRFGGAGAFQSLGMDDLVVDYVPSCLYPIDLAVSHLGTNSADVTWRGFASNYQVQYRLANTFMDWSMVTSTTHSATLANLLAHSTYELRVRGICGVGDTSAWSQSFMFTTLCTPVELPYSENFDNYTVDVSGGSLRPSTYPNHAMPDCWIFAPMSSIYNGSPAAWLTAEVNTDEVHYNVIDGVSLRLYSGINERMYAVLPMMNAPLDTLMIRFDYAMSQYSAPLMLGVMTDPSDYATFQPLQRCAVSDSTASIEHYFIFDTLDFNQNYYIAFVAPASYGQITTLDNVWVDYIPACIRPGRVTNYATLHNQTKVRWFTAANASEVRYRSAFDSIWMDTIVNADSVYLNHLTSSTSYDLIVRSVCGNGDSSDWSDTLSFTTECEPYMLPFEEDFSRINSMYDLNCWAFYRGNIRDMLSGELTWTRIAPSASQWKPNTVHNLSPLNAFIKVHQNNRKDWMVTPQLSILPNTELSFKVAFMNYSDTIPAYDYEDDKFYVMATTDNGTTWTRLMTWGEGDNEDFSMGALTVTPQTKNISLSQFVGQTIRVAFYVETTVDNGYNNLYLGDISIEGTPCAQPSDVTLEATAISATLTWSGTAQTYEVALRESASPRWPEAMVVSGNSYTFSSLMPNVSYDYRIRSICSEGVYSHWNENTFSTLDLPCHKPNVTVTSITGNGATFSWQQGINHAEWEVNVFNAISNITVDVTTTTYTATNLQPATEYHVAVRAKCAENVYSDWSDTLSFTVLDCPPVTNVVVSDVSATTAKVVWNSGDAEGLWEINYGLEDFGQGEGVIVESSSRSYTLTELDASTSYDVYVRAVCNSEVNSIWSDKVSFTTQSTEGIDGVEGNFLFAIYPNPTSGATTISLQGVEGQVTISVVDMNGRTLTTETIECGVDCEKRIDVAGLAQGTYFVRILGDNLNSVRKLIVR